MYDKFENIVGIFGFGASTLLATWAAVTSGRDVLWLAVGMGVIATWSAISIAKERW